MSDVLPLLERLLAAFGSKAVVARLLDVDPAMITRWRKNSADVSPDMATRIIDLHDVFNRAFQVFRPRHAILWLLGSEPLLAGARPLDILGQKGAAPLIEVLAALR